MRNISFRMRVDLCSTCRSRISLILLAALLPLLLLSGFLLLQDFIFCVDVVITIVMLCRHFVIDFLIAAVNNV